MLKHELKVANERTRSEHKEGLSRFIVVAVAPAGQNVIIKATTAEITRVCVDRNEFPWKIELKIEISRRGRGTRSESEAGAKG